MAKKAKTHHKGDKARQAGTAWRRRIAQFWSAVRYRVREVRLAAGSAARVATSAATETSRAAGSVARAAASSATATAAAAVDQVAARAAALRRQTRTETERNIWYLYIEVFWAGIFMAAVAFNATYALRLGATNTLIGWLSSIPSLLAMVVLVPAARFLESQSDRGPWMRGSLLIGRAAFVGAAMAPWVFPRHAAEAVVAVLILRTIPMHVFSAGFSPMLADVIPVRDRAVVMANRSIISSATIAVCTFLFGKWMDAAASIPWAGFPTNYQVVYVIGALAGVLSAYFVSRIKLPKAEVITRYRPQAGSRKPPKLNALRATLQTMVQENRGFVRITVNTFVFNLGAWLVGPLYMIFFIKQLGASDGWVGLNTTIANIGVIAGNLIWRRLVDRLGAGRALRTAVPLAASYAFLVSFFPNLNLILLWGILINLINPGVNLSHVNTLYTLCPPERRASYMALYATIANVGAFVAPMVGVALSNVMDIRWLLLIGGVIRLAGAGMFHLFKIEAEEAKQGS